MGKMLNNTNKTSFTSVSMPTDKLLISVRISINNNQLTRSIFEK
jgi:hypothetical protein